MLVILPEALAEEALVVMRSFPEGEKATVIGRVEKKGNAVVKMRTLYGNYRDSRYAERRTAAAYLLKFPPIGRALFRLSEKHCSYHRKSVVPTIGRVLFQSSEENKETNKLRKYG